MIICGYAGIGKSYLAKNIPGVIDLESTPFEKDWDRYAKCAIHYHKQGYLVLVSCHKELREILCNLIPSDIRITIVPNIKDKELYRERYESRGNTTEFINIQMNNWETWLNEKENRILSEHWIEMEPGEFLYDTLKRISKKPPCFFCSYDECPVGGNYKEMPECVNPLVGFLEKITQKEND